MIIIADSGSTKTRWALKNDKGETRVVTTSCLNPVTMSHEQVMQSLMQELVPQIEGLEIDKIYFYGAGCAGEKVCGDMANMLIGATGAKSAEVHSDLLGAARALCGHRPGVACILGTGSNSCLYDGEKIAEQVSPLGFILGDEGSGAVIGRTLIGNVLKRQLPKEIIEAFEKEYSLTPAEIIERVYRQPRPNAFLGSFMPFVAKHIGVPEMEAMVVEQMESFFRRNVLGYSEVRELPLMFTGSIAEHFEPQLRKAARNCGLEITGIIGDPMERLTEYH